MRRARISYTGSYHHVMNRGIQGEKIFLDDRAKVYFLESMEEKLQNLKIRVFAYCLMDNHYHLILQNSSGRLSEFMKQLNGQYGIYYRKRKGGKGYVFQNRFKSTLIQEDKYLKMAILYVLLNPARGGVVKFPSEYRWSSIREYYAGENCLFVDNRFVEELFGERDDLERQLVEWSGSDLPIRHTRHGDILGEDRFIREAIKKFDRRKSKGRSRRMRQDDYQFKSAIQVISEFEDKRGVKIEGINLDSHQGKALRGELLVMLKDEAGLTYLQVIEYPLFQSLKYASLGQLYKRIKEKMRKREDG